MAVMAGAQTIESLREDIRKAEEEIRLANELLARNRSEQSSSESELRIINSRITQRRNIVSSLEREISLINRNIAGRENSIATLERDIGQLRSDYANMVYVAYKNYKLNNFLLFIFSSRDFNDATKRIAFMRRFNRARELKVVEIDSLSYILTMQLEELNSQKRELDNTRSIHSRELAALSSDQTEHQNRLRTLQSSASQINRNTQTQRAAIENAQQQISRIIAEEMRSSGSTQRSAEQEREIVALSGRFEDNRGKMPYPVRGAVVTDYWGEHDHPTQRGIKVKNTGIDLSTSRGAEVRAVFDGDVTAISPIPGMNNAVILRHGSYRTVYMNLTTVTVRVGDKVTLNQHIGNVPSGNNPNDYTLHFEVWRETENLNPINWITR